MLDAITPYAPLISAGSALISTVAVLISTWFIIWTTSFRKTRRDKIDELKEEMQVMLSDGWANQIIYNEGKEEDFFESLKPKFQKPKYKVLHQCAYDELGFEGKNPVIKHGEDFANTFKEAKFAQWRSRRLS